jgi:hypothetical protein
LGTPGYRRPARSPSCGIKRSASGNANGSLVEGVQQVTAPQSSADGVAVVSLVCGGVVGGLRVVQDLEEAGLASIYFAKATFDVEIGI